MSSSYTIIKGDTLAIIAAKKYGDGRKYKIIQEANPQIKNPNLIITGDVIIIPELVERVIESVENAGKEPDQIGVSPDTVTAGRSDEVALMIDGFPLTGWVSVEITTSFDSLADTFSLSIPWNPDNVQNRETFRPFKYTPCVIYVGGEKVLSGIILNTKTQTSSNARVLTIDGYSRSGIIADVSASSSSWPISINGLNLQQIAEKLTRPYFVKVIFQDDPGAPFRKSDKVTLEPEEKIGSFLIKLARQRGFVLGNNDRGHMVFKKATTDPAVTTIIEGRQPYINSSASYNGQNRFSDVTAVQTETKSGAGQIATVSDPELKRNAVNRPFVFKATDTNPGGLLNAATAKLGRMIAESVSVSLSVIGWHKPDSAILWKDNERIIYQSDGDMIYEETEFLIRSVKYGKGPDQAITGIDLVLPEAYSGEIRDSFPWE